ncbi:MAG: hypothetical protein R3E79_33465 [Caldilineaceae bacterium]
MATKKKTASAKKQSASAARPRSYSALYKDDKTRSVQTVVTPKETVAPTSPVNWGKEYAYVVRDLRTLGVVAAVLFGIIIITGFFM